MSNFFEMNDFYKTSSKEALALFVTALSAVFAPNVMATVPVESVPTSSASTHELPRLVRPVAEVVSSVTVVPGLTQTENNTTNESTEKTTDNTRNTPRRLVPRHQVSTEPEAAKKLNVIVYTSTHMDEETSLRLINELVRFKDVVEPGVLLAGMPLKTNEAGLDVVDHELFNTFLAPFLEHQIPVAIDPTALRLMWDQTKSTRSGDFAVDRAPCLPLVKLSGFGEGMLLVEGSASLVESVSVFVHQMHTNPKIKSELSDMVEAFEKDPRFGALVASAYAAGVQ